MKSLPKSEPAIHEDGGLEGRRVDKQPNPEYSPGGDRLLRKWLIVMAAIRDQRLHGSELRVLTAVLDRMNSQWRCWPGYGRIASDTGLARRTATRAIDRLVNLGYLEKRPRGTCQSNIYLLGHLSTHASIDSQVDSDSCDQAIDPQVTRSIDPQVNPLSTHRSPEPGKGTREENPKKKTEGEPRARVNGAAEKQAGKAGHGGLQLVPPDWQPDDTLRAWCESNYPHIPVDDELQKFRDRSSAKGARFADFAAGFRGWIRRAHEFAKRDGKAPSGGASRGYLN